MKRKIDFQRLVNFHGGYDLGVQLDAFAWMVQTGADYRAPGDFGVFEWLYGISARGCWSRFSDNYGVERADGVAFLRAAFVRAVVDTSAHECVQEWRAAERIGLGRARMLDTGGYVGHLDFYRLLETGWRMAFYPNPEWSEARWVYAARLTVDADGWQVLLEYGFSDKPRGARWTLPLLPERARFAAEAVAGGLERIAELRGGAAW
jgi:hypothetical protein